MRMFRVVACALVCCAIIAYGVVAPFRQSSPDGMTKMAYSGWSGVIRVWMSESWQAGSGSLAPYLLAVGNDIENRHPGVYVHVRNVTADIIKTMAASALPRPDMVLVSPGVSPALSVISPLTLPNTLRPELLSAASGIGAPIAMGGYALIVNQKVDHCATWDTVLDAWKKEHRHKKGAYPVFQVPFSRANAAKYMLRGYPTASAKDVGTCTDAVAWRDFTTERAATLFGNQRNVKLMLQRTIDGKGFPFVVRVPSNQYVDQWSGIAIIKSGMADQTQRMQLCVEFVAQCLSESGQARLKDYGAFSVLDGASLYEDGYFADFERALSGKLHVVPINP